MANEWMYMLPTLLNQNSKTDTKSNTEQKQTASTEQASNSNTNQTSAGFTGGTSSSLSQIPKWLEDASMAGVGNASGLLNQPVQAYGGDLTAGVNDTQKYAGGLFNNMVGMTNPYFNAATGATAAGMQQGPEIQAQTYRNGLADMGGFMNPYINNVISSIQGLSRQNLNNALNQTNDQAISAKAFGGSRHGVQEGVATAQNNLNDNNIIANLLNTGYNNATNLLGQDISNNLSAQNSNANNFSNFMSRLLTGGNQIANLGVGQQNADTSAATNIMNYGNLQQNTANTADTAKYNEWLRQQNLPAIMQQLYNQTISTAPHSTATSNTANQYNVGVGNQNTAASGTSNSTGNLTSNTTGSTNTNTSGMSFNPVQSTTSANPLMGGLGGAATGAYIGSIIPGIGTGIGAAAGGLLGALGSKIG